MVVPDAIHHDASKQRIVRTGDPVGESDPALCIGGIEGQAEIGAVLGCMTALRRTSLTFIVDVTTNQDMGGLGWPRSAAKTFGPFFSTADSLLLRPTPVTSASVQLLLRVIARTRSYLQVITLPL